MITLIINYIEREYPQLKDELISTGHLKKIFYFYLLQTKRNISDNVAYWIWKAISNTEQLLLLEDL